MSILNQNGMQQLMQQLTDKRPDLQPLIQSIQEQDQTKEKIIRSEKKLIQHNKRLIKSLKKSQEEIKRNTLRMEQLEEDMSFYLSINDELAAALGACPECWGEDSECEQCEGEGTPGAFEVDPKAFQRWIAPVVKQFQTENAPSQADTSPKVQEQAIIHTTPKVVTKK